MSNSVQSGFTVLEAVVAAVCIIIVATLAYVVFIP